MSVPADRPVMLVTGARKGIGRALARNYAERDYLVVGCSRKNSDFVHRNYRHYELDVADEVSTVELIRAVNREYGRLDCIINNAGIASMNSAFLTPASSFDRVMATNVRGTFLISREGAKVMRKSARGRIVNFTSVAVPFDLEGEAVYAASKSAVERLTRVLAREFAPLGITVNAIGPAPTATDLTSGVPSEKIDALVKRLAIPRLGSMEDVVNVVDFFINPSSDFITGQIIYLGGA